MKLTSARSGALATAVLGAVLAGVPARAAVLRVPTQYAVFTNAVAAAAPGDTVQVVGNGGAEFLANDVRIEKDLTIQGGWRADFALRDASTYVTVLRDTTNQFTKPVFRVMGPYRFELDGVWIWGGKQGVSSDFAADVTVRNCTVRGQVNRVLGQDPAANRGAAIRVVGGTLLVENTQITTISTAYSGAGLAAIGATSLTVRDSRIDNCVSTGLSGSGGAVYVQDVPNMQFSNTRIAAAFTIQDGGLAYLTNCSGTFTDCLLNRGSASNGGGISLNACNGVVFDRCVFEQSIANQRAGGLEAVNTTGLQIRDSRFASNQAGRPGQAVRQGGALWFSSTEFAIERTEFESNHLDVPPFSTVATEGGAAYALSSTGTMTDCSFKNELATGKGGAWFQIGGLTQFTGCRFENNEAGIFGGALSIELGGQLRLDHSLLVGNRGKFGGAISTSFTGAVVLTHCTLTQGTGSSAGGAVYVDTGGTVQMTDTIACCSLEGEVVYCAGGGVTADHCDVWNDDATNVRLEWGGACADPTGTDGNLRVSPEFCLLDSDYRVSATSPCVGAASDGSDLGWRPAGCSGPEPLSLQPRSWGRIKAAWR